MKIKKLLRIMLVDTDCVRFVIQNGNKTEITPIMMVRDARNKYNRDFYSLKVKSIRPTHDELELPDYQDYIKIVIDDYEVNK